MLLAHDELGCLAIEGPDSTRFLQGQCTADAAGLPEQHWTLAGFANVKGRLYANGRLARLAENHYWFLLPRSNVNSTLTQLNKYAAFFKTTLSDVSTQWHFSADPTQHSAAQQVTHTDQQVVLHCPEQWQLQATRQPQAFNSQAWAHYELQQGLVWITAALVDAFLPQELEWDHLGGVSYQKGCYTGQEVIARLHYRGQLKKGLRHLSGSGTAPEPLAALHNAEGKNRAQIARVLPLTEGWQALAVVRHDTTELLWQDQPITLGAWVAPQPTASTQDSE